jgi:hypothetical protein
MSIPSRQTVSPILPERAPEVGTPAELKDATVDGHFGAGGSGSTGSQGRCMALVYLVTSRE